jgi:WD40 repeat protein
MPNHYDCFISYGRANSKAFAQKLTQRLEQEKLIIWFDQHDIPPAVDWQEQINDGIEKADNFLFIISPHSVKSEYCLREVELAVKLNKRILPLLHVNCDAEYDLMHPIIKERNWLLWEETSANFDFETSFQTLLKTLREDADYVKQHTKYLVWALHWERNQQQTQYLLTGEDRVKAESWLLIRFSDGKQAPCIPTDLHCKYICESTKNANNLLTQVFICHNERDNQERDKFVKALNRQGITSWTNKTDIQSGTDYQTAINKGIEGADNFIYLLSKLSVSCTYCQRELAHALKYNKRIIPILVESLDLTTIPLEIQEIQFLDFTEVENINQLVKLIKEDTNYYYLHKTLLVKALKWKSQAHNRCLLLRGYNLLKFESWLNTSVTRELHPPLPLHFEYINASKGQTTEQVLDVFISYSRSDGDFARKLNDQLQELGKTTWFDQESIAVGEDFNKEIEKGIESCDNFVFIISPRSINSPHCADEVEYAFMLNKRFITILLKPVESKDLHPALAKVQWLDFRKGDFYLHFNELVRVLDTDRDHVRNHSKWNQKALEWQENQKSGYLLLRGPDLIIAQTWLKDTELTKKLPPPSEIQKEYIRKSKTQNRRNRYLVIGGIISSLVSLTFLWLRAEKLTTIAQLNTKAAKVELLTSTTYNVDGLVLAIAATGESQEKLGEPITSVERSLLVAIQTVRERNIFLGNQDYINSVAFSPDGQYIASGGYDNTVRLWDIQGDAIGTPFRGHTNSVTSVKFSPDGKYIISGSEDKTLRLWDLQGNTIGKPFTGHTEEVTSVDWSSDGKYIVSGSYDQTLRLWDPQGNPVGKPFKGHTKSVYAVAFSPDGKYIASGSEDRTIRIWDLAGNPVGQPFTGYEDGVSTVTWSPDGKYIVGGSYDKTIRVWNIQGDLIGSMMIGHVKEVYSTAFSPNGKYVVSGAFDNTIRIWRKGENLPLLGHTNSVYSVAVSSNSKYIVSGSSDTTIRLWNLEPNIPVKSLVNQTEAMKAIAFNPNGNYIITAGLDHNLHLWDLEGNPVGKPFVGHTDDVYSVAWSPDGKYIVSGSLDKTVRIWDLQGNPVGKPFVGHTDAVYSVAWSPDGKYIASGSFDNTLRLWDPQGNSIGQPFKGHEYGVKSVAWSPDSKYIVSGSLDKTIRLWDQQGNSIGQPFTGHTDSVNSVTFSPDGKYILSGSVDNTVRLWDLQGNLIGHPLSGHTDSVNSVIFTPNGKYIISGSSDNSLRLWDLQGNPVGNPFLSHNGSVNAISFSAARKYLVTASDDKTIKLWDIRWEKWLEIACNQLKDHPVLKNPQSPTQKQAKKTCEKYIYN